MTRIKYKVKKLVRKILDKVFRKLGYKIVQENQLKNYSELSFIKDVSFDDKKNFNSNSKRYKKKKLTINWLVPHIGKGGGGHTVIFRFIRFLNSQGHTNRLYVIDNHKPFKENAISKFIRKHYFDIGDTEIYRGTTELLDSDINISTSWETAYYSYYADNTKLKSYFILDFEPYFYPMSIDYLFAEQTYNMGYLGLGGGKWIYDKVIKGYDMEGMYFDLGVDFDVYKPIQSISRDPDKVVVYFRSWSPRRGAEIIIPALKKLKEQRPRTKIVLIGEDQINYDLPFDYENIGVTTNEKLAEIYSSAAITLVFSLTNYSLLPQDAMACGSLIVELDTPSNRAVYEVEKHNHMVLAEANPHKIADSLIKYLDDTDLRSEIANNGLKYISEYTWERSFEKVERELLDKFRG